MASKLKFKEPQAEILVAWAERSSGPGWANQLIWIIEKQPDGKLTRRALQPEQQTKEIWQLFDIAESTHIALMRAVKGAEVKRKAIEKRELHGVGK